MSYTCSIERARACAIGAAGLGSPRPPRARTLAESRRRAIQTVRDLGYVQLDSVNVLARAQDMVLFSRTGAVPPDLLTTPADVTGAAGPPPLVEQWAHEASVLEPHVARQRGAFPRFGLLGSRAEYPNHPDWAATQQRVLDLLAESPATALAVADALAGDDRHLRRFVETCALDAFDRGQLVGIGRTPSFQRVLARPDMLWPDLWVTGHRPDPEDAAEQLTEIAVRRLGVARVSTVADWFRLPTDVTARALDRLQAQGLAHPVDVTGTRVRTSDPWWAAVDGPFDGPVPGEPADPGPPPVVPQRDRVRLLSPFDPLVAHRPRLLELFGVHYRIGIYTPAPKRAFGYYDLLLLVRDEIVARVDLRADRAAGVLQVLGFWLEPGRGRARVSHARALRGELANVARWQGLDAIEVAPDAPGDGIEALIRVL